VLDSMYTDSYNLICGLILYKLSFKQIKIMENDSLRRIEAKILCLMVFYSNKINGNDRK